MHHVYVLFVQNWDYTDLCPPNPRIHKISLSKKICDKELDEIKQYAKIVKDFDILTEAPDFVNYTLNHKYFYKYWIEEHILNDYT